MKKRALIIPGWKTYPSSGFAPWLINQLMERGYEPHFLQLPHNWFPTVKSAEKKILDEFGQPDESTLIISHSFGARVALSYLARAEGRADKTIFISPLFDHFTLTRLVGYRWKNQHVVVDKVVENAGEITIIHSADDKLVPVENGRKIKELLKANYIEVDGHGHFCPADGCFQLPLVTNVLDKD